MCTPTCETGESGLSLGKGEWNPPGPCGPAVLLRGMPLRECLHQCPRDVPKNLRGDPGLVVAWTGIVCGHVMTHSKAVTSASRKVSEVEDAGQFGTLGHSSGATQTGGTQQRREVFQNRKLAARVAGLGYKL